MHYTLNYQVTCVMLNESEILPCIRHWLNGGG